MDLDKNEAIEKLIKSLPIEKALKELECLYTKVDKENPYYFIRITTRQISKDISLSAVTIREHLYLLRRRNYIEFRQSGRNGYRIRLRHKAFKLMNLLYSMTAPSKSISVSSLTPSQS